MKVHLLENCIDRFISDQLSADRVDWYYPHAMIQQFQVHWSAPVQSVLHDMIDHCLSSEFSQRWWKRDHYRPKEIMLSLIDADSELATIAWKDLSNEAAGLEGRISRFTYYCNELLQIHRQKNYGSVETYHHQDAPMISLYLAGLFPDKCALYPGLDTFKSFCKAIGSPDIPLVDDLVRYMKVASIVFTYLQRNASYVKLVAQRGPDMHKIPLVPFQIAYEVIHYEGVNSDNRAYGF